MDDKLKLEIAKFRFGVIADFVTGVRLGRGERERIMREKCGRIYSIPGSVRSRVTQRKQQVLLCIDEANLLRYDVLEELHTLNQFALDSRNMMSIVLCGQNNLVDKLQARTSAPLAS